MKQESEKKIPRAETLMNKLIKNKQIFVNNHDSASFLKEVYDWYAKQFERTSTDHPYRNADRNVLLRDCEKKLIIGLEQIKDPQAKKIVEKSKKRTQILENITTKQNSTIGYSTFQCFVDTVKLSWYAPTKKDVSYLTEKCLLLNFAQAKIRMQNDFEHPMHKLSISRSMQMALSENSAKTTTSSHVYGHERHKGVKGVG